MTKKCYLPPICNSTYHFASSTLSGSDDVTFLRKFFNPALTQPGRLGMGRATITTITIFKKNIGPSLQIAAPSAYISTTTVVDT